MIFEKEYIEECLYDFFESLLPEDNKLAIIFENENGPRPVPPFLSVSFNSVNLLGTIPYFTKVIATSTGNFQKSKQTVERYCTLRGFGKSSEDIISEIRSMIEFEDNIIALQKKGLVISQLGNIIENSANYSDNSETFFSMDFVLTYERIVEKDSGYIEHTEIKSSSIKDSGFNDTQNKLNIDI